MEPGTADSGGLCDSKWGLWDHIFSVAWKLVINAESSPTLQIHCNRKFNLAGRMGYCLRGHSFNMPSFKRGK